MSDRTEQESCPGVITGAPEISCMLFIGGPGPGYLGNRKRCLLCLLQFAPATGFYVLTTIVLLNSRFPGGWLVEIILHLL